MGGKHKEAQKGGEKKQTSSDPTDNRRVPPCASHALSGVWGKAKAWMSPRAQTGKPPLPSRKGEPHQAENLQTITAPPRADPAERSMAPSLPARTECGAQPPPPPGPSKMPCPLLAGGEGWSEEAWGRVRSLLSRGNEATQIKWKT